MGIVTLGLNKPHPAPFPIHTSLNIATACLD